MSNFPTNIRASGVLLSGVQIETRTNKSPTYNTSLI